MCLLRVMFTLYEKHILPRVIECSCGGETFTALRRKVVPQATGRVLEVGMGTGHNLAFYDPAKVEMVWGLEPADAMRKRAQKNIAASAIPVEWLGLPGEQIPLDDNSADTILLTFTLCSITDWQSALANMRRVLKPGGKLLFCEHGLAPDANVAKWQHRLNAIWGKFAGGCNINRPIPDLIRTQFDIGTLHENYTDGGLKLADYMYWGEAT